jgi:hypothetical protein
MIFFLLRTIQVFYLMFHELFSIKIIAHGFNFMYNVFSINTNKNSIHPITSSVTPHPDIKIYTNSLSNIGQQIRVYWYDLPIGL